MTLRPAAGRPLQVQRRAAVAFARGRLLAPGGDTLGTVAASTTPAGSVATTAARRTGVQFVVLRAGRRVGASTQAPPGTPRSGDFAAGGRDYRGRRQALGVEEGRPLVVAGAIDRAAIEDRVSDTV